MYMYMQVCKCMCWCLCERTYVGVYMRVGAYACRDVFEVWPVGRGCYDPPDCPISPVIFMRSNCSGGLTLFLEVK